jgi:hypothetical protein
MRFYGMPVFLHLRCFAAACLIAPLLFTGAMQGQTADSLPCSGELPVAARWAMVNVLDQVCVIRPDNAIEKYTLDGRLLARYSDNRSGTAYALDVSNPLKTLVWYADFRMVVFLDRSFTPLGALNLIQAGFPEVRTVAVAQDGQLWLYDEVRFRLVKLDAEGRLLYESQPLNQMTGQRVAIACIRERDGRVWASDPGLGWLEFDAYAQFQRLVPAEGVGEFEVQEDRWVWLRDGRLWQRPFRSFSAESRPFHVSLSTHFAALSAKWVLFAGPDRLRWCRL